MLLQLKIWNIAKAQTLVHWREQPNEPTLPTSCFAKSQTPHWGIAALAGIYLQQTVHPEFTPALYPTKVCADNL